MQPMMIIPPDVMSADDMKLLRENGICVVVASDPAKVKFVDPLPAMTSRTEVEHAAIQLSRKLMTKGFWTDDSTRRIVAANFVDILIKGTALDPNPTQQEREKEVFDAAKIEELRRLGREEAKEERAAAKAAKASKEKK